jgi:AcrR family transcriptional regulator
LLNLLKLSDKQKDSKREEILKAAELEFVAKGYDGARTMEIARRAGVGHPLLHYHFKTKGELFKQVVQGKMGLLRKAVVVSWEEANGSFIEKLSKLIGSHFDFVKENANYLRFQFQEMERHPELFIELTTHAGSELQIVALSLQQELDLAAKKGEISPIEAQTLIEDIIALNLFFLTAMPTLKKIEHCRYDNNYLEERKQENIRLILSRLTRSDTNNDSKCP